MAGPAPVEGIVQHRKRDSIDADPTTASMYDDGDKQKTYSAPGKLNWKFAGGPKAEYDASNTAKDAPVEVLTQHRHHHHHQGQDSFDADPTTASMYDDGDKQKTYSAAGKLNWKFAGGPKAEYDAAVGGKKADAPVESLHQRSHHRRNQKQKHHRHHRNNGKSGADTFDNDPDTTSMYDDQHVYSNAGGFKASAPVASAAPPALMQHRLRTRDSFDHDPTTTSMYDDTF
jgi:hypothetical protein